MMFDTYKGASTQIYDNFDSMHIIQQKICGESSLHT